MRTILAFVLLVFIGLSADSCKTSSSKKGKADQPFRVMFYNVENLFDSWDDPAIEDEEFLPAAERAWDETKLSVKLNNISEVIQSLGQTGLLPDMVGFCEVENRKVLDFLLTRTTLKSLGYSIVHFDSPDKRGIDVALIYRKDRVKPLKMNKYPVIFPGDMEKPTRDILYVKAELPNKSQLHVLVNHWPSRSGGQEETEPKRMMAAKTAKRLCDSISFNDAQANILLMGDFNDYPNNKSITESLAAQGDTTVAGAKLYDLMYWQMAEGVGSHQYKGEWGFLDQFILSGSVMSGSNGLKTNFNSAKVFRPDFLVEKNEKYGNWQPKRTYGGTKYLGGYSDHLPVYIDLRMKAQ
ncbi:MAG: endonuclease [Bacteroidetes bacterium]|nr:endonuclease [Bacteroidota bacterium]